MNPLRLKNGFKGLKGVNFNKCDEDEEYNPARHIFYIWAN